MIINKIYLKNYRSHENKTIELARGINLILGKNGSGKSSVLEAIGNTLFSINDRTGKKTGKTFISYGKKDCEIEIEFTANDDRLYSIKKIFKVTGKKTLQTSTTTILKDIASGVEYADEIENKLEELCGIKKDYSNVYDNIIITKQNEFINVFKAKPQDRAKIFNKIFNTDIYVEMYEGALKIARDKYSQQSKNFEIQAKTLTESLDNIQELEKNYEAEIKNKEVLEEEKKSLSLLKEKYKNILEAYDEKERELKNQRKDLEKNEEDSEENKINLSKALEFLKKSKMAKQKVLENLEGYEKFNLVKEDLEKINKNLINLKKIKDKNIKLTYENKNLESQCETYLKNIDELKVEIENLSEMGAEKEKKLSSAQEKEKKWLFGSSNLTIKY